MTFFAPHSTKFFRLLMTLVVIATCDTSSWAESSDGQIKPAKTVVVIHCDYPPVSFWDKNANRPSGFIVDIMDNVAERAGLQVSYVCKTTWADMVNTIERGEADLGALMKSEEREKELNFSSPIDISYLSFFARAQSSVDADKVPEGHIVGVVRGSMSHEQLKNKPGVSPIIYSSYQDGLFALLSGEIALFAGEESMVLKRARETRLEDRIKKVGKPFLERERGLAVKKDNVQLLALLNKTLQGFTESPEYQRIYLKWYGAPTPYWTSKKIFTLGGVFLFIVICSMAFWRYVSISTINRELVRNISERKRAEEVLRESEERYRAIVESQTEFVDRYLPGGILTYVNNSLARCIGLKPEELIGKSFYSFVHEDDRTTLIGTIESLSHEKPSAVLENRVVLPDGTVQWHLWTHSALLDAEDRIVEYQSVGRDITERKRVEEALGQSEEMMRSVLNSVDEGFIVIDRDYRIVTSNRAYSTQVNLSCDDIIGKHCYEVSHKIRQPCFDIGEECAVMKAFETGAPCTAYHTHGDADGNKLYVETKAFPLKDVSGTVTSVIESITNMTETHLLQEERLKTQKLDAIGMLAGGIAHDFNNLLQGVFGYISLAKLTADDKDKSISSLEEAEKALHMSVKLTNQLLTFSKGGKPVKKLLDLRPVIENASKFAVSGSRTEYELDIDRELWSVEADEGQMGQVIQNIVLNADQAMPMGGTVSVTARNVHAPGPGIPVQLRPGLYAAVSIRDSGLGIPEQYMPRIFDPYFTTKEKGNGLGLATSYSIIKNHNGFIDVRSEIGKGTTFLIYLPAIASGQKAQPLQPSAVAVPARNGKVLIMDDEQIVRDVAGELIKALGHEVAFAAHGAEALEKYQSAQQSGKPFDVVILDLTIRGGMGGIEALKKLRETDPEVKGIVSSGYSDDSVLSEYRKQGFVAVLKKPYTIDGLRATLDGVLK